MIIERGLGLVLLLLGLAEEGGLLILGGDYNKVSKRYDEINVEIITMFRYAQSLINKINTDG